MAIQKILMPYNFTASDNKALDFIINTFGNSKDIKITLFNAYTPVPEIDMKESPELQKMSGGMAFLADELKKKEEGLISARRHLLENGFSDDQIDYIFKKREKSVAKEVIDTIAKGTYEMLVLSRRAGKVNRLFERSIHNTVLSTVKNITICIAT